MSPDAEPTLGLSIPLFDEAALVESTVHDLVAALESTSTPFTLALVDNGSTDGTSEKVQRLATDSRILAVHLSPNAGYGGGIRAGLQALSDGPDPDIIGWTWGDGQVDPACIAPLYRACVSGSPMAKAVRISREDGLLRTLQGRAYGRLFSRLGQASPDPHGCPKLFRRDALRTLNLKHNDWFLDAEAMLGAAERGWEIAQETVTLRARRGGKSKVHLSTTLEFCVNLSRWKIRAR